MRIRTLNSDIPQFQDKVQSEKVKRVTQPSHIQRVSDQQHRQTHPSSPSRKTKPAFVSPKQKRDEHGRLNPITHVNLGFKLDAMLHETDRIKMDDNQDEYARDYQLPGSYKSFAKWEMHFDKDTDVQELIQKQKLEDSVSDYCLNKANRDYKWRLLYENITTQDSIKFFSAQMKKNYMQPQITNMLTQKQSLGLKKASKRISVSIPGMGEMIVPDSYEPEKFDRPDVIDHVESDRLANVSKTVVKKVLNKDELHKMKYRKMFQEIDHLKDQCRELESFRKVIETVHRKTNKSRKKLDKNSKQTSNFDHNMSQNSELNLNSVIIGKVARKSMSLRKSVGMVPKLSSTIDSSGSFAMNFSSELPYMAKQKSNSPENSHKLLNQMSIADREHMQTIINSTKGTLKSRLPRRSTKQFEQVRPERTKIILEQDLNFKDDLDCSGGLDSLDLKDVDVQYLATSDYPDVGDFKRNSDTQLLNRDQCISIEKSLQGNIEKKSRKSFKTGKAECNTVSQSRTGQGGENSSKMMNEQAISPLVYDHVEKQIQDDRTKYKNTYDFQKPQWQDSVRIEAIIRSEKAPQESNNSRRILTQNRQHRVDRLQQQFDQSKQDDMKIARSSEGKPHSQTNTHMATYNTRESVRSKKAADSFSMYNPKNQAMIPGDLQLRKSVNVQRNVAKSKDFASGLGQDANALAMVTDQDDQDSSTFLHNVDARKYTIERAKEHYKHVNSKFKVDTDGNLLEKSIPVTPLKGQRRNRGIRNKSLALRQKLPINDTNCTITDYPIDVFNHSSRKAFYKFTYQRNPSIYGNSTVSTKSNFNKTSHGVRMSNYKSGTSDDDEPNRHIGSSISVKKQDYTVYPISTTDIFNNQFAQESQKAN